MIRRLFHVHDRLLPEESRRWLIFAVLGSFFIALMDMVGVAAMLPLMLVATGAPGSENVLAVLEPIGVTSTAGGIIAMSLIVGSAFLIKTIAAVSFRWWMLGRTTRLEALASASLLRLYSESPFVVHRTRSTADMNRQFDFSMPRVFSGLLNGYLMICVDLMTLLLTLLVLLAVSPAGTLAAIVVFGGALGLTQMVLRRRQRQMGKRLSEAAEKQWEARIPMIEGFRDVRLSSSTGLFYNRFKTAKINQAGATRRLAIMSEMPKYLMEVAMVVGIGAVAGAVILMGEPDQVIAILGVFTAAAGRMIPTMNRLATNLGVVRSSIVGVENVESALESLPDVQQADLLNPGRGHTFQGDITVEGVGFRFPDSTEWTLRGIDLKIEAGRTVALVGSSGAGKSSMLDLILGLFTPAEGHIKCGGLDIGEDMHGWHQSLGVVSQDVYLINSTLRSNIAFGVPDEEVNENRLAEAIESAQLNSLVEELPEGTDTILGERGVRISGGQRQRIGIARALYRNPRVLVLDEATSALDNLTEKRVSETIESLAGQLTIIIVAHRLSTVKNADKIIFMDNGSVAAEGTFDEVQEINQEFAELVTLGRLA